MYVPSSNIEFSLCSDHLGILLTDNLAVVGVPLAAWHNRKFVVEICLETHTGQHPSSSAIVLFFTYAAPRRLRQLVVVVAGMVAMALICLTWTLQGYEEEKTINKIP